MSIIAALFLLSCLSLSLPRCCMSRSICDIANCIHGVCILDGSRRDGFRCDCNIGFTGAFCERLCTNRDLGCEMLTPPPPPPPLCSQQTCLNGECDNSSGSSQCVCYPGWTGEHCNVDIDDCGSMDGSPSFFGRCSDYGSTKCIDGNATYSCVCVIGFTGKDCEKDIDECDVPFNRCSGHGTCINKFFGYYSCICDAGFTGYYCNTSIVQCASSPCQNQATCEEQPNGEYRCICPTGYTGTLCSDFITSGTVCSSETCTNGGTCYETSGNNFTCHCPVGYFGSRCSKQNCTDNFCENGGLCRLGDPVPVCECSPRYEGSRCEVNRCENITCLNSGTCEVNVKNFQPFCQCQNNYTGVSCEIDSSCFNQTCTNGDTCSSMNGNCVCPNGMACINAIASSFCDQNLTCFNGGTCINDSRGNFTCHCPNGFYGNTCSHQVCTLSTCRNGGTCSEGSLGPYCMCSPQYGGTYCEMDKCEIFMCLNGGTCSVKVQNLQPSCQCQNNYTGVSCEIGPSCSNQTCTNGDYCNSMNGSCVCPNGMACIKEINPIRNNSACDLTVPCLNGGTCIDETEGNYTCLCRNGFYGQTCSFEACTSSMCMNGSICVEGSSGPYCACSPHYEGNCEMDWCENMTCLNGGFCHVSNETRTCSNNGTCLSSNNSALCHCAENFTGQFCQDELCQENTCDEDCSCVELKGETGTVPECQCAPTTAPLRIPTNPVNPVLLAILILVLITALVICLITVVAVILLFHCCKKKRKGKEIGLHTETRSNSFHASEASVTIDVRGQHFLNEEAVMTENSDDDMEEAIANPDLSELKDVNLAYLQSGPESDAIVQPEADNIEIQSMNISFASSGDAATPSHDTAERDAESINLMYLDTNLDLVVEDSSEESVQECVPDVTSATGDLRTDLHECSNSTQDAQSKPPAGLVKENFSFELSEIHRV